MFTTREVERGGSRSRALAAVLGLLTMIFVGVALPVGEASAANSLRVTEKEAKQWCLNRSGAEWEKETETLARCVKVKDEQSNRKSCMNDVNGTIKDNKDGEGKFRCVWKGKFKNASSDGSGSSSGSGTTSGGSTTGDSGGSTGSSSDSGGTTYGSGVGKVVGTTADPCPEGVKTSIIGGGGCYTDDGKGGGVYEILLIILNILTAGVGVLGVLGLVISGVTYLTARDNEQQVAKAKSRILQIVIGLAIFAVLYVGLQWLIPGGIFGN